MKIDIIAIGFMVWLVYIIILGIRKKRFPSIQSILLTLISVEGCIIGLQVVLWGFLKWPNIHSENIRWVIGIGGVAVLWLSSEQLRKEWYGKVTNGRNQG